MSKISPCLWFNGQAEEAARFYVSVFGGSVDSISRYPHDVPGPAPFKEGDVLLVEFTLFGQSYQGLNGGPEFGFTEAVSLSISCKDQAEVDRRRAWPLWLGEGQIRPVLADRAGRGHGDAPQGRPRHSADDGRDDDDAETGPCPHEGGL